MTVETNSRPQEVVGTTNAGALYATRRDPRLMSTGARVGVVARHLGTPLMPWQQHVADIAGERLDSGAWRYPVVVVTVPRQAGKTTLMRAVAVDRAMSAPRQVIYTTAQTGKDAGERWKDMVDAVLHSPLGSRVKVYRGAGAQQVILPNASRIRAFAPTPTSIHGSTPHLVMIDEAWAFDAARGEDLIAAINPAQITLRDRQLWIVSSQGDAASAFLDSYIDLGRASVGDPGAEIAYFEWAAEPDALPYARDTLAFHPAVGHTITVDDLLAQADTVSRGVWERAYLNRKTLTRETILDLAEWDTRAAGDTPLPDPAALALGYDVAQDGTGAAVWAAWVTPDGRTAVKHVASGPGPAWMVEYLTSDAEALALRKASRLPLAADDSGPVRQVTDELRKRRVDVDTLPARDYATACSAWLREAAAGRIVHDGHTGLRDALAVAVTKPLAGQAALDPVKSAGPIDHLRAAVVASRAAVLAPVSAGKPVIVGG